MFSKEKSEQSKMLTVSLFFVFDIRAHRNSREFTIALFAPILRRDIKTTPEKLKELQQVCAKSAKILEDQLSKTDFLVGSTPTLAVSLFLLCVFFDYVTLTLLIIIIFRLTFTGLCSICRCWSVLQGRFGYIRLYSVS